MKRATHNRHVIEGFTQNYDSVSSSFITVICMSHFICAMEEGHEFKCVSHFLASWGPPETSSCHWHFLLLWFCFTSNQNWQSQMTIGNGCREQVLIKLAASSPEPCMLAVNGIINAIIIIKGEISKEEIKLFEYEIKMMMMMMTIKI